METVENDKQVKYLSISAVFKKKFRNRLICSSIIFTIFTFIIMIYSLNESLLDIEHGLDVQCTNLSNYIIQQVLVKNDDAIQIKLSSMSDKYTAVNYVNQNKKIVEKNFNYIWPFSWTYSYPIKDIQGNYFGYIFIKGKVFDIKTVFLPFLLRISILLIMAMFFYLLIYPLVRKIPQQLFITPIMEFLYLLKRDENVQKNNTGTIITKEIYEIQTLLIKLLKERKMKDSAMIRLAAQVAHDIRSPLASLNTCIKHLHQIPEEQRILMRNAADRINYIADNLLVQYKAGNNGEAIATANNQLITYVLGPSLESITSEIRLRLDTKHIDLNFHLDTSGFAAFSDININEFKRILSNLINNSLESFDQNSSNNKVTIALTSCNNWNTISIEDNGCGIADDKLQQVFAEGISFKSKGSGLGLAHAKATIESWGGEIELQSKVNEGTTVKIKLLQQPVPKWFLTELNLSPDKTIVILDDDPSVHDAWKQRIYHVSQAFNIINFTNTADLQKWINHTKETNWILLSDYELYGSPVTGLEFIKINSLADKAILVTSHYENDEILLQCESLGLKLLPKNLFPCLPLYLINGVDLVFIDDNDNLRKTWEVVADIKNINLRTYADMDAFNLDIDSIAKQTKIYIDYELANDVNGLECAKLLYERGFTHIYLATGYDLPDAAKYHWLKGIVGKEFPE